MPAAASLSVSVAVIVSPVSTSETTMSFKATTAPPSVADRLWVRFVAVGASFTAENALLPPFVLVSAVERTPLVEPLPTVRSHARKVSVAVSPFVPSGT